MHAELRSKMWRASSSAGDLPIDDRGSATFQSARRRITSKRSTRDEFAPVVQNPRALRGLRQAFASWTTVVWNELFFQTRNTFAMYSIDTGIVDFDIFAERARDTAAHLPRVLVSPSHRVLHTKQLHSTLTGLAQYSPKSLTHANMIRMRRFSSDSSANRCNRGGGWS
eukprot:9488594-Pyramimonas_sp.AAC.1